MEHFFKDTNFSTPFSSGDRKYAEIYLMVFQDEVDGLDCDMVTYLQQVGGRCEKLISSKENLEKQTSVHSLITDSYVRLA